MGCKFTFLEMSGTSCVWTGPVKLQLDDLKDALAEMTVKHVCKWPWSSSATAGATDLFVLNDLTSRQPLFAFKPLAERLLFDNDTTALDLYNDESDPTFLLALSDGSSLVGLYPSQVKLSFLCYAFHYHPIMAAIGVALVVSVVWFVVSVLYCCCEKWGQNQQDVKDFPILLGDMLHYLEHLPSNNNKVRLVDLRDHLLEGKRCTKRRKMHLQGILFPQVVGVVQTIYNDKVEVSLEIQDGKRVRYAKWVGQ